MTTHGMLSVLKNSLLVSIKELFTISASDVDITMPSEKGKGDLVTNIAFLVARQVKLSPLNVAEKIVNHLSSEEGKKIFLMQQPQTVSGNSATWFTFSYANPGFINIHVHDIFLNQLLADITELASDYGKNETLKGQTWIIEHTSPNPNKAMHIGHLRNTLIGTTLSRLCAMSGAHVIQDAVDNNRGISIAKAMWGFLRFKRKPDAHNASSDFSFIDEQSLLREWNERPQAWFTPDEANMKADHFVGDCYALGNDDSKLNPDHDTYVRSLVVQWENHDPLVWKLWEHIISYAHTGIEQTLKRIGTHFDRIWHEHEHYQLGKDLILQGLERGLFKKLDDGAVISNLESYGIPDTVLLKADGTSLYITQDLALNKIKKEKDNADRYIWVIGPEQTTAMKQVFAICEQLGIGSVSDFVHIPYGLVHIIDEAGNVKKMSSRGGRVLLIDDFIDAIKNFLLAMDRGYTNEQAESIALSALRYIILKSSRNSDIAVSIKKATDLKGDSGVYLLYTYARMQSLLAKSIEHVQKQSTEKSIESKNHTQFTFDPLERDVLVKLLYFPMIIKNAVKDYAPNLVAEYILTVSHAFNSLYANEQFITDNADNTAKKVALTKATAIVFENAFTVLGIDKQKQI